MAKHTSAWFGAAAALAVLAVNGAALCQPPTMPAGGGGQGGRGPGGPGGGGGPMGEERKLVKQFDADKNGRLDIAEREAARKFVKAEKAKRPNRMGPGGPGGGGGPGGPMGMGEAEEEARPGLTVLPADVTPVAGDLYDPTVLRTIFLDFDSSDWESELEDFYNTDVEVPATMTVDGKKYPGVGVHFRGASSFFGVSAGHKRSLNVAVDFTDDKLALRTPPAGEAGAKDGNAYRTLNLLNSHEDPSFMSSVLYSTIANQYIPAPRANYVRVVINGESWGVYVNLEQFNKDFVQRNFHSAAEANKKPAKGAATKGAAAKEGHEARWKVKGSPQTRAGLEYIGEDLAAYKQKYQIKSTDRDADWQDLVRLCKVLNTTPPEELEAALKPILDVDAALRFLALDVALANGDGYWVRSSDYSIYKDAAGVFHIIPHDMNESFRSSLMMPGGGGGRGGPGGGRRPGLDGGPDGEPRPGPEGDRPMRDQPPAGADQPNDNPPRRAPGQGGARGRLGRGQSGTELDPLVGLDDAAKPLRSKLLAVPALRERYLGYVREIAQKSLDWKTLGPVVAANRALIEKELQADTRKLSSFDAFLLATGDEVPAAGAAPRREPMVLRGFADKRRGYLLGYTPKVPPAVQPAAPPAAGPTAERGNAR